MPRSGALATLLPTTKDTPMTPARTPLLHATLSRRTLLGAGLGAAAAFALAACAPPTPRWLQPDGTQVKAAERARGGTGRVTEVALTAAPGTLDLAGTIAKTAAYGAIPASVIRLGAGDTLRATLRNDMDVDTTIHWHGIAMRNDMDGVPHVTQAPVAPGETFVYDFITPHPGTYWFHPHVGAQVDQGLYGALIVEDPNETLSYDDEWVIVLDDWLDGVTSTPDEVLKQLQGGMDMGGMEGMDDMFMRMGNMLMGADSDLLGGDAGDVYYPYFLVNGKPPADPSVFTGAPGSKVRIRFINAGGDTAFRVALGGHAMTVVHSDGFPLEPVEVDSVLIGMGERYDVIVTLGDGVFPLVAEAEGKRDRGFALVRTADGTAPAPDVSVPELASSRIATVGMLKATDSVALAARQPDRELTFALTGGMAKYDWGINDKRFDMGEPLRDAYGIRSGERVRLNLVNESEMWHPFHLHGHTYQHTGGGPRKDTSVVLPGETISVDFDADNPGLWLAHCHNIYHGESGMMAVIGYEG